MIKINKKKKGFTLVELLAVIVILAIIILIATTVVIPLINKAKKKALLSEAQTYINAAEGNYAFDHEDENMPKCINISDLNGKYVKKNNSNYAGAIKVNNHSGNPSFYINLTDGKYYVTGSGTLTLNDIKSSRPSTFLNSCGDYNPVISDNVDEDSLAYNLVMNRGGSTLEDNLNTISEGTLAVNFRNTVKTSEFSGMFKAEDDDGASYYYRGVVNDNWVKFGGFLWRILRINGDGSIRMIYSGLESSTHTGNDALIRTRNNATTSVFNSHAYATTYTGFMYNADKSVFTYPETLPNENLKLNVFPRLGIDSNKYYYLFKNFNPNTDCTKNGNGDDAYCTLTCNELDDDCIYVLWKDYKKDASLYSTTHEASVNGKNYYLGDYRYSCFKASEPITTQNPNGTTSVTLSCPIVYEIVGVESSITNFPVRYHGWFSPTIDSANMNVLDSDIKKELEYWYEHNILNIKDSSNTNYLEDYLYDSLFCNDRENVRDEYPFRLSASGSSYDYKPYNRTTSNKSPSLKCTYANRDGFTLRSNTTSRVKSSNKGNSLLKYPIGLITVDEVTFAGASGGSVNQNYFLYINNEYWTMSPTYFYNFDTLAYEATVSSLGSAGKNPVNKSYGIRPVINLSPNVLFDSGDGTEGNPYTVKLSS